MAYSHNGTAKQLISLTRGYGSVDRVTTQFAYTGSLLTGITIPMAQTWAIQYDSSNRIISITSPVSGTVGQAGYTPAYVMKVQYYSGSTVVTKGYGDSGVLTATYTLDGNGQATMVDDSWGHTTQATYNGDHQVASLTDGLGHTLTNVFGQYVGPNGSIGLVTETDAPPITPYYPGHAQQAPKITYRYDPTSYDLLERDTVDGASTRYSYDGHHRLLTTAELVSATTSGGTTTYHRRGTINTYGQYGELTAVKDGRGVSVPDTTSFAATPSVNKNAQAASYTHNYGYSPQGDPASSSTPPITTTLGNTTNTGPVTTQYGYDSDGDQTSVTSPNGNTPYIGYDQLGRQSYTTDAPIAIHSYNATPHTTTAYDGDGDVAEVKNGNEDVTDASYDPQGRLVSYTNAISGTTLLTYNANELTAMQDPQGNVTTYAYDAAGRLTQQADAAGEVIGYGYDTANNVTTITYGDGTTALRTETRTYDALDLVSTDSISGENLSGSLTTTYNRDLRGNLVREQHPNNDVTFTSYDLVDQVIAREIDRGNPNSPSGTRQETFGFDLAGNPISQTDMRGAVSTLTRDGDDRVTRQVDQYTGSPTITTSISYDPDGNVPSQTQTINGQSVQASAGYNAMDWPTSTTDNVLTTSYVGDGQGRTQQQTIQNGAASSPINLDNLGRANSIGDGTDSAAFTYDGNNLLTTVTLPGNAREAMRYDGASRLLETTAFASSLSDSFSYGYDHVGWTTSVNSTVTGVGSSNQTLTHDGQGRLLATSGAPVTGAWAYDGQDNISTATHNSVTSTYSYDPFAANELSSVATPGQATVNYSYDANGDTTSISNGGSVNEHLSYDAQGRLAQVTLGSPVTQTIAMTYNAQGKRASYTVTPAGAGQPSLAEQFAYRDDGELAQVATSGTRVPTAYTDTYLYRQDGSPLELIRVAGGTTSRYWYVLDGRDNVVALTDVHGNVVDSYQYDLWGKPTSSSESVPPALPLRRLLVRL